MPLDEVKFQLVIRWRGMERITDLPLAAHVIELALEACLQDLSMLELMRQLLVKAIRQDLINALLREDIRGFDQDDT
jgi:hypothetical protein